METIVQCNTTVSEHDPFNVRKGEIWYIAQKATAPTGCEMWSNRPAIIVSNDTTSAKAGFALVVYLTTQKKKDMPFHIKVWSGGKEAIALCEQIHTVDKSRIGFYIGTITTEEMKDIDKAILFSLGISNSLRPNTIFQKWANAIEKYDIDLSENLNDFDENSVQSETNYTELLNMYKHLYEYEKKARKHAESELSSFTQLYENKIRQNTITSGI